MDKSRYQIIGVAANTSQQEIDAACPRPSSPTLPRARLAAGFTLIEIAVVLGIVMIVLSLGLTAISAQLSSASYTITKKRQDAIKDALVGYFGAHNSLPCPYAPVLGTPAAGTFTGEVGAACPQPFGTVPFAALGLAREIGEDGWGNLFSYQVYTDAVPGCPGTGRDWANPSCFGTGKSGSLTVNDGAVGASTLLSSSGVAVVVSHGINGLGAWVAAQGTRNAPPLTCVEVQNAGGPPSGGGITWPAGCPGAYTPNTFYKGESQANDDVVAYLTATDLLQPLIKQGALNSPAAQVNVDLQTLYDQAIASSITPLNCPQPLTLLPALPVIPPTWGVDPWGNSYGVFAEPSPYDPALCLYSTGGTGVAPTGAALTACACTLPAICRSVTKATLTNYRLKASATPCP